jgi:hypothetical protein
LTKNLWNTSNKSIVVRTGFQSSATKQTKRWPLGLESTSRRWLLATMTFVTLFYRYITHTFSVHWIAWGMFVTPELYITFKLYSCFETIATTTSTLGISSPQKRRTSR